MNSTAKTALWIGGGLMAAALVLPSLARALAPASAPAPYQPQQPGGGRLAEAQGWTSFAFSLLDSALGIGKGIFDWAGGSGGGSWGGSGGGADINEDPSDAFLEGDWKN